MLKRLSCRSNIFIIITNSLSDIDYFRNYLDQQDLNPFLYILLILSKKIPGHRLQKIGSDSSWLEFQPEKILYRIKKYTHIRYDCRKIYALRQ